MEYANELNVETASEIIFSSCQMLPKSFSPVSDRMNNLLLTETLLYSIMCGSTAEIYIQPLNTCIDDIDILVSSADELAFSGDFPTLPSDVSGLPDIVKCYKIESYQRYPSFVRLLFSTEIVYNWKCKRYNFGRRGLTNSYKPLNNMSINVDEFSRDVSQRIRIHGPAIKLQYLECEEYASADSVSSVWCPQWPREAQNWRFRPRNQRWPTIDTISEVVQNGCHVVFAQHRNCRDDSEQWRFSFSVAEVILLQSWTQIQQIVYHLLRFFAKRVLIQKDCPKEDEVLCPYHLKTLMLWTCEETPPEWWNSSSAIAICCQLLKKLSTWMKRRHCPNYFIPEANLFHEPSNPTILENIEIQIMEFCNSDILGLWFVENYITPSISKYFPNVSICFLDFLPFLFKYNHLRQSKSLDLLLSSTISDCLSVTSLVLRSGNPDSLHSGCHTRHLRTKLKDVMAILPTISNDLCFAYYDNLLRILHIVHGVSCEEISCASVIFVELVNTISMHPNIIRSKYHNFPKTYTDQSSRFNFLRAQYLMENLTGSNSRSAFQIIVLLSRWLLRKALEYDDIESNGIVPSALAYLASLHFVRSESQQVQPLCLAVVVYQAPQNNEETLNAGCLLFIDDVARIVGLCVLHKKITGNNVQYLNRQLHLDLRLSPKVFTHYLKVVSAERIYTHLDFDYDLPDSIYCMDEYLTLLITPTCCASAMSYTYLRSAKEVVYHREESIADILSRVVDPVLVKHSVINSLMEYALENMTLFYNVIRKDFDIQCSIADCYHALYLYTCLRYDEVMDLCEAILHDPEPQGDLKYLTLTNVLLLPPFDSFFDRDIQSLLGIHTLFYHLSPFNDNMRKLELNDKSTFAQFFARIAYCKRNSLSRFLIESDPIRCYYFLGSQYLANYLKVRCCMDCKRPYTKALTEFSSHKTQYPFECIIRRYILRMLNPITRN